MSYYIKYIESTTVSPKALLNHIFTKYYIEWFIKGEMFDKSKISKTSWRSYHPVDSDRVVVRYAARDCGGQEGVVDISLPVPGLGNVGVECDHDRAFGV